MTENVSTKSVKVVDTVKYTDSIIDTVETDAIIVRVQGWSRRVYFDKNYDQSNLVVGQTVKLGYFGDLKDKELVRLVNIK